MFFRIAPLHRVAARGILSAPMSMPLRAASRNVTSVILIAVIASLCFSVGEGLRLTPFPVSALMKLESDRTSSTVKATNLISIHKYGPLDVPAQHQKRNKRQVVPLDSLLTATEYEIPSALHSFTTDVPSELVSFLVTSQSAGRAPPFIS